MSAVIVLIILSGVLAVGGQQGWFDKKDPAETGVVSAVTGTADLTRDGIASPLSADTALRDGDVLTTQEHAELTLQAGDSTMKLGAGSSLTVTHAATDGLTVQVTTGQFFTAAGEAAPVTLEFGAEGCTLSSAAADLTVHTGSETLYLLSGALTLAIMILPLIMRTTEEALLSVPDMYREGSFGLGAGRLRTVTHIVLPTAIPGVLSGIILAIGRIVGETAALMYTSGTVEKVAGLMDSGSTLALHMYKQASEGLYTEQAYATSVILLALVLLINFCSSRIAKLMMKGRE